MGILNKESGSVDLEPTQGAHDFNSQSPQYQRDFASGQVIASLAYELKRDFYQQGSNPGMCTLVLENTGYWHGYEVTSLPIQTPGLYGYIFTEALDDGFDGPEKIKVAFMGTDPVPKIGLSDFFDAILSGELYNRIVNLDFKDWIDPTVFRDLDLSGAGYQSYMASEQDILDAFSTHIAGKAAVELSIGGHSLGGRDAEYFLISILKAHEEYGQFENITQITINTFNSPGVYGESSLTDDSGFFNLAQDYLKKNAQSDNPIKIIANIGRSEGDPIQHAGENIFQDLEADVVTINMVTAHKLPSLEDQCTYDASLDGCYQSILTRIGEFISVHSLSNSYFSPDYIVGKITPQLKHTYLSNESDFDALNKEFDSGRPSILQYFPSPLPVLNKMWDQQVDALSQLNLMDVIKPSEVDMIFDVIHSMVDHTQAHILPKITEIPAQINHHIKQLDDMIHTVSPEFI